MDGGDLQLEQLAQFSARVGRELRYLNRVVARMESLGFRPSDGLYRVTLHARDAIQHLRVKIHYLECDEVKRLREL